MITTVTQKNMVTIPAEVGRKFGIKPGFQLDWEATGENQITVRVLPSRDVLARQLFGKGKKYAGGRDLAVELDEERDKEG
jgi:AbrB family looped-hinge helix DNA binding protein